MKLKLTKIIPYFFYLLIVIYIFQFRYSLDSQKTFVASDGAVKFYQSVQYKENGFFSLTCPYPGKEFDSEFKYFPISYPWVISGTPEKCVFEYPPFFYWLGSIFLFVIQMSYLVYLPLLFFAFNILFFDFILRKIGLTTLYRVFLVIISFVSFPLLTAMDYTESPAFQSFYLIGFYFFWRLNQNEEQKIFKLITAGVFFGLAFVLRLEILMTFSFLCLIYFLLTHEFKKSFFIYLGFVIIASLFVLYNIKVSGHPLGFRYVSSIDFNDNAKADIWKRLTLVRATIWGDQVMVGIFKFQPLSWLLLFIPIFAWIRKIRLRTGNIFLLAGWISMLVIPFYVTVYGGVGYFGLRYIEAPFFLVVIGFAIYLSETYFSNKKVIQWSFVFLFLFVGYYNWLSTKEGLKIIRNSSTQNIGLQKFIEKSKRFVIHSSLYTSIWIGKSFFEKTHINLVGNQEFLAYLQNISPEESFVILQSPEDIYISSDIPKKLHYRYKTNLDLDKLPIVILEESTMNGVRLVLAHKK
ncbi:MAG: hypothetical protein KBA66_19480 [Leptospiraceae bacterium]|nr:hypothetical protein [Leptospiraceae bacterium]